MAKKKEKSWLLPAEDLEQAAQSSIRKTEKPTVKKKQLPTTKQQATIPKKKEVPSTSKQKPGPKGTGEELKICRLTQSAHKSAKRMAFETEETLTEYLSRLVKEDYDLNYGNYDS